MSFSTYRGLVRRSNGTFVSGGAGEAIDLSLANLADYVIDDVYQATGTLYLDLASIVDNTPQLKCRVNSVDYFKVIPRPIYGLVELWCDAALRIWAGSGAAPLYIFASSTDLYSNIVVHGNLTADKVIGDGVCPVGSVTMFAGSAAPAGWLLCNGASVLRVTYPDLFAVIGTTYGAVDGTHFTLPDLRGRAPIGVGAGAGLTARALADSGGEETHVLTTPEIPAHTHTYNDVDSNNTSVDTNGDGSSATAFIGTTSNPTGSTGGGGAHNNMQPFAAVNFIIKT